MECHIDGCSEEHINFVGRCEPVCVGHWMDYLRGRGVYAPADTVAPQAEEPEEGADGAPGGPAAESEPDVPSEALAASNAQQDATFAAVDLANRFMIDLQDVEGTGGHSGEKIVKSDVKDAI